jgi:hypothetical protein
MFESKKGNIVLVIKLFESEFPSLNPSDTTSIIKVKDFYIEKES